MATAVSGNQRVKKIAFTSCRCYTKIRFMFHENSTSKSVSAKYIGLPDKSSKKWFGPAKIVIGPVKNE